MRIFALRLHCLKSWVSVRTAVVLGLMVMIGSGCPSTPPGGSSAGRGATNRPKQPLLPETFETTPVEELAATVDLGAEVEWEDRPVYYSLARLREKQSEAGQLATDEEALKLRNDSDEANDKILSGLGQLYQSGELIDYDAEIKRLMPADIKSANPVMSSSVYESWVGGLIGFGLFSIDERMLPFAPAEYVVSWQTSKDKLYDKVVIRDDLVWSDGKPITAHDVEFSYKLIMDDRVPIPAVRTGMDGLDSVKAYNDHTLVYKHKESLATNVWNLNFPVIPKHIYEKSVNDDPTLVTSAYHAKLELDPVCGGAYRIVKRDKGQEIVLERREDWYMRDGKQVRPKPHFKTVRFRIIEDSNTALLALKNGDIEDMEFQPEQWVEQTNDADYYRLNTKARGTQWVYYYFGWNNSTPYFDDVRVRQAISHCVDYEHILETLCFGLYPQCTSEYHEDAWAGPEKPRTPYRQNFDKAVALLEAAGWVDTDGDGIRDKTINGRKIKFEFTIMCASDQLRVDICTSLKESLGRIGITCHVRPTEFTVMQEKAQKGEFQAMFGGWGTGADPYSTENLWKTGENRNYCNYSNSKVDELFTKAKYELEQSKRAEYYRQIDDILWEEQPYTWLYYRSAFYGFNKRLRGYGFSPRGPYNFSPGFESVWAVAQ